MRIAVVAALITALALAGCAATYTFEGKIYNSKEDFARAVDDEHRTAVASIVPLPAPVTKKRLAIAIPSTSTIFASSVRNYTTAKNAAPPPMQVEIYQTLAAGVTRSVRGIYDGAVRRNIYTSVRFVELDSMTASPAPSADEDVVFFNEPSLGSGQWYFATAKDPKQVFAYDKGQTGIAGKMRAFNDALQLHAVRQ